MLQLTDTANQTLWVNPRAIGAIVIPSLLTPGPGTCTVIITGGAIVQVTRAEAERFAARLNSAAYADLEAMN